MSFYFLLLGCLLINNKYIMNLFKIKKAAKLAKLAAFPFPNPSLFLHPYQIKHKSIFQSNFLVALKTPR